MRSDVSPWAPYATSHNHGIGSEAIAGFVAKNITLAVHIMIYIMSQILGPCTKPCASKVECKPGSVLNTLHEILPYNALPSCDRLSLRSSFGHCCFFFADHSALSAVFTISFVSYIAFLGLFCLLAWREAFSFLQGNSIQHGTHNRGHDQKGGWPVHQPGCAQPRKMSAASASAAAVVCAQQMHACRRRRS
mgnify:CR=1 FL=1